jgi:CRP/FNR family transcriptional regulator, cyclic AMP receptor protein
LDICSQGVQNILHLWLQFFTSVAAEPDNAIRQNPFKLKDNPVINLLYLFTSEQETVSFTAGQTVFEIGDEGRDMYVVLDGQVDVVVNNKVLETIEPGGLFGELALISSSPRSASVIARSDCRLMAINEQRFFSLVQEFPFFSLHVMSIMAERIRRQTA